MKIGTVIGKLETARTAPGLEDVDWVQVRLEKQNVVAADLMGAKPGQLVLLLEGEAARRCRMDLCADALVVAVLRQTQNKY